jgi:hypothetical protein
MAAGAHFQTDHAEGPERRRSRGAPRTSDPGSGWIAFAGAYLLLSGGMTLIWGIVALANKSAFVEDGLVWSTFDTWGWIAVVVGALQMLAGALVLGRQFSGQWLAGVLCGLGVFVNFLALGAYPVWSVIALVTNGLVLWAITAHGDEFE